MTDAETIPRHDTIITAIRALAPKLEAKGVRGLALFGSVLHGRAEPQSDVDLLLDLEPGARMSLLDRLVLRDMIADAIGHPVDLIPRNALIDEIREKVERDAEPIFP